MKKTWRTMRSAPKKGMVKLLGKTDASSDELTKINGLWNEELGTYTKKSGLCIFPVAWRDAK